MQSDSTSINNVVDLSAYRKLRLALISDTHGDVAPEVLEQVNESDVVLHAGDIMGAEVLQLLTPKLGVVVSVLGNNDFPATWQRQDHEVLTKLGETVVVRCSGGDIAIEHGHRMPRIKEDHYSLAYKYSDKRMVLFGHTHIQCADTDQKPWLVNPGAAGFTRNMGGASCTVLTIDGEHWNLKECKFPPVSRAG